MSSAWLAEWARDVVAREIVAKVAPEWEDYPEIGEHDWNAVVRRVEEITSGPSFDAFTEAYAFLSERAAVQQGGTADEH